MSNLENNTEALQEILNTVNALPEAGSDVTAESIRAALGYVPAKQEDVEAVSARKVSLPMDGENPAYGTTGQFAISDGAGGITWLSLTNVAEVGA